MVSGRGVGAAFARGRAPVIMVLLVLGTAFLLRRDNSSSNPPKIASRVNPAEARAAFGRLPMSFEQNQGQSDGSVKFLARGNGYGLYLTSGEAALVFGGHQSGKAETSAVEMKFAGANPGAEVAGSERLPGHSNYFIGNDPSRWVRNVSQFGRVVYREVYPGIDLAFYGKQGRLEYDFDVAPGADPDRIQLDLTGADKLQVASNGDLVLAKSGRELRFQAPHIYQNAAAGIQNVQGAFVLRGNDHVSFKVGDYDRTRTLVIDPVFVFSTFLGGSGQESCGVIVNGTQTSPVAHCPAIAVDSASRVYVAGATTSSSSFPVPAGGTPPVLNGGADVFLVRFDTAGTALEYTTYLGGSGREYPTGVAVDSGFNVYVAGTTDSSDFPTTPTALQTAPVTTGVDHAFFSKFDSSGSANLYTTYLSGTAAETTSGLAVDSLGRVYIIGITASTDFPTTPGALETCPGQTSTGTCPTPPTNQFFFSKLNPGSSGLSSLLYSTYLGGSTPSSGGVSGGAIAVDSNFVVYLAGGTTFTDMPVVNAYESTEQGGGDVWVAKFNPPANNTQQYTPSYETFFGGPGNEVAYGIATDGSSAYVTGSTDSPSIATVPAIVSGTAFPRAFGTGLMSDAFVLRFGPFSNTGTTQGTVPLSYFTYLGGSGADVGLSILADATNQYARVTGWTNSGNFPNTTPLPGSSGGGTDAFVARIFTTGNSTSGTGTSGTSSTSILGGSGTDIGTSIALDPSLNMYVTGDTSSGNFPIASALQSGPSGPTDAFVSKLGPSTSGLTFACTVTGCPASNPVVTPTPVNVGGQVTFTYSIYNLGDPVAGVVFTANIGANTTLVSTPAVTGTVSSSSCGSAAVNGTVVCNLGTVNTSTISSTTSVPTPVATVSVVVSVTSQILQQTLSVGNSGTLTVPGATPAFTPITVTGSAQVNDFSVSMAPPSAATVIAGGVASFKALVTPTGAGFPASVSLSCASGLPSGAVCSFTNNPIPNMSNGPQSRPFEITTTARVTTPASLFHRGPTYALWMPIFGAGLLGAGISRKRRFLLGLFFAVVLGIALLQMGCGGGSSSSTTTGTPAGTYTVTVNATAGAARSTTLQLTVQ
jgi:hypothetical protein